MAVDPFLVAKAVKEVMRVCPHRTATGSPLVWNDFAVFLDLTDWSRIKKLEGTLVRDLGGVVEKELAALKAEMVGPLNVRLVRDESGSTLSPRWAKAWVQMLRLAAEEIRASHVLFVSHTPETWGLADCRIKVEGGAVEIDI